MAKITCPNREYTGISASVSFTHGVGETTDQNLIVWFREHGYTVEDAELGDKKSGRPKSS